MKNNFETKFKEKIGINFNQFYLEQKPKLIYHLMKYVGDEVLTEDYAEETFTQTLIKLDQYDNKKSQIQTWMYRIGLNLVIKDYKESKRLSTISLDQPQLNEVKLCNMIEGDTVSEKTLENNKLAKISKKIIKKLPPKYSEIMHLREIERWKYKDIATHMKMPLGTVKCRIKKGRSLIVHKLKKIDTISKIVGNE